MTVPHTAALHLTRPYQPTQSTHPTHPHPHLPCRYLPLTMESEFQDHLGEVLPLILDGLSDEVREGGRGRCIRIPSCVAVCVHPACESS